MTAITAVTGFTALALLQLPPASRLLNLNELFKHEFWGQ
ncbi:hypothetical protein METH_22975 (plasmid) [Leisingera methylohalidivorans DSM 14336]|uniref:Uncharacterized protein n=1 Tax=Leisingera methylohalidivorans DSM 14336 TaxID=999552 RepID=V9W3H5_9RHOB|nr:hypothetical protein METH_22975 [Leisingera methylohalidivorans DSM 14336]